MSQRTSQAGCENVNSPRLSHIRLSGTESNPLPCPLHSVWLYLHTSIGIAHSCPCISAFNQHALAQTQRRVAPGQIPSQTPHQPLPLPQIPSWSPLPQFALAPNQLMLMLAQLAHSPQYTRGLLPLENQQACLLEVLRGGGQQVDHFHNRYHIWHQNPHGHCHLDFHHQRFPTLMQYHCNI